MSSVIHYNLLLIGSHSVLGTNWTHGIFPSYGSRVQVVGLWALHKSELAEGD